MLGLGFGLTFGLIVDPLQPNTQFIAYNGIITTPIDYWLQPALEFP
jgi:hypothetical protein